MTPLSRYATCAGYEIHYTEWGARDNPRVVVCVHGLTRNCRDFDALAQALEDVLSQAMEDGLVLDAALEEERHSSDSAAAGAGLTLSPKRNWHHWGGFRTPCRHTHAQR